MLQCQFDSKTPLAKCLTSTLYEKYTSMTENDMTQTDNQSAEEININPDESVQGNTHNNDVMEEENEIEVLRGNLDEQKDKYLRLIAEFDNYKRRNAKERMELIQTAGREIITAMLDVLDDTDRAEKQLHSASEFQQVKDGVQLVFNKFRSVLKSKGLVSMESINKDFDAELHEAITEIPAPTNELVGKVIDEVTKGYYLGDKIIRHAKVVVGK